MKYQILHPHQVVVTEYCAADWPLNSCAVSSFLSCFHHFQQHLTPKHRHTIAVLVHSVHVLQSRLLPNVLTLIARSAGSPGSGTSSSRFRTAIFALNIVAVHMWSSLQSMTSNPHDSTTSALVEMNDLETTLCSGDSWDVLTWLLFMILVSSWRGTFCWQHWKSCPVLEGAPACPWGPYHKFWLNYPCQYDSLGIYLSPCAACHIKVTSHLRKYHNSVLGPGMPNRVLHHPPSHDAGDTEQTIHL